MANRDLPTCLFCGRIINPPENKDTEFGEIMYGKCECGAIYVCEPTGHNQGEALVEAMFLASPSGIESIEFGKNFEIRERDYDCRLHQYIYTKYSPFQGKLFFIKAMDEKINREIRDKIKISKKDFLSILEKDDFDTIAIASLQNPNVFGWLIALSYDKESPVSWKAIKAMGYIAETYVKANNIEPLRNTIRKLLWSMTDESGGIGWRAAELIGEIVFAEPSLFEDIIPILWSQREEESFLESVLRSMIRLSNKINITDYIEINPTELESLLKHENDEIKALTSILIHKLKIKLPVAEELKDTMVSVYKNGNIVKLKASRAEKFL